MTQIYEKGDEFLVWTDVKGKDRCYFELAVAVCQVLPIIDGGKAIRLIKWVLKEANSIASHAEECETSGFTHGDIKKFLNDYLVNHDRVTYRGLV